METFHSFFPSPTKSQVVVEIRAAGVNRADLLQAAGHYSPPPGASDILGLECSGLLAQSNNSINGLEQGLEVVCLLDSGGYAEAVAVDERLVLPKPRSWSMEEAGGLMEAACTAWSNLVDTAQLTAGETVLIHGGSGGVGTFAIQLAKALGAHVIATARTAERAARCADLGADHVIAYSEWSDFPQELPRLVAQFTDGHGVDVILDVLGAQFLDAHTQSLAVGGRLVVIGMQRGAQGALNLSQLLTKRASIHGTTLRSRPLEEKARIVAAVHEQVWPLIEQGTIAPCLDRTYGLDDAQQAHSDLASGKIFGKAVLLP